MEALSLSNHFLLFSPRTVLPPQSKTLTLKNLPFHPRRGASARSLPSHLLSRPPRVAGTDPKTIYGDEEDQISENKLESDEDRKDIPSVKALVQAYKKAILDGDDKLISEFEAAICSMEKEKNNLSLKFVELTAEITAGKKNILRLKADFENYRKRSEKDRARFTSDVQGEVIESLLPMVDSFESAKQHSKPETEKEKKIDTSYQGIYKQFVEILRSLHVAVVGTVGKPFNPAIHEAVGREESHQFKEGIITQELRRGFVLGERLLRPATVKVSTGPGHGKASSDTEKCTEQTEAAAEPFEDVTPSSSSS